VVHEIQVMNMRKCVFLALGVRRCADAFPPACVPVSICWTPRRRWRRSRCRWSPWDGRRFPAWRGTSSVTASEPTTATMAREARAVAMADEEFLKAMHANPSGKHLDCHYIQTYINIREPLFLRKCRDGWRAGLLEGEWPKDFRSPVSWDVRRKKTAQEAAMALLSRMADGARRELERNERLMHFVSTGESDRLGRPVADSEIVPVRPMRILKNQEGRDAVPEDEEHRLAAASLKAKIPERPLPVRKTD